MPVMMFASLRGSSGKDTKLYLNRFDGMSSDGVAVSFDSEPILNSLIYISKILMGGGHELFFFLHAVLVCFLFSLIIKKYERARVYLLTIGPMFLIDGLTNGMRITIAYHLFVVAVLYRKQLMLGGGVFLAHVSGLLMYFFKVCLDSSKVSTVRKIILLVLCSLLIYILSIYLDRLLLLIPRVAGKFSKYSEMVLPTKYSGVVDIFVMVSIFTLSVWTRVNRRRDLIYGSGIALFIGITFYVLNQNSLAFIRVGKLFIVALCVSEFATRAERAIPFYPLFVIGILYNLNFLRQIIFGHGFLPYPGIVN